jgi:hypothetical protein
METPPEFFSDELRGHQKERRELVGFPFDSLADLGALRSVYWPITVKSGRFMQDGMSKFMRSRKSTNVRRELPGDLHAPVLAVNDPGNLNQRLFEMVLTQRLAKVVLISQSVEREFRFQ